MSYCKLLLEQILERLSSQQKIENIKESGKETSRETDTLTLTRTTTPTKLMNTHIPSATIHCSEYLYKQYTVFHCSTSILFITPIYEYNLPHNTNFRQLNDTIPHYHTRRHR